MSRIGAGDQEALGSLYDLLAPLVHGIAVRTLGGPSHSEEATLETFLQIWQQGPRFDPGHGLAHDWIALTAQRTAARTALQRPQPRKAPPQAPAAAPGPPPGTASRT
jgi:RNA polymerase sigma-70 factor (ECF subfamily)